MNSANVTLANDDDGNVILSFEVRYQECLGESQDEMKVRWKKGGMKGRLDWDGMKEVLSLVLYQ